MDKQIVDKLIKFGLITNVGVNASDYKDVDDLIAKGIITVPGAKDRINELLREMVDVDATPETIEDDNALVFNPEHNPEPQPINEVLDDNSPVIDETPETEPVIDETPETLEPIVDTPETIEPIDEKPETVESEIVVEEANDEVSETTEEPVKKTRKSKKTE